jgi:hypothetical protein
VANISGEDIPVSARISATDSDKSSSVLSLLALAEFANPGKGLTSYVVYLGYASRPTKPPIYLFK